MKNQQATRGPMPTRSHRTQLVSLLFGVCLYAAMTATGRGQETDLTESSPGEALQQELRLVRNARQVTFEGRRAGEGYFSADGRQMVFQSEREPGNPFFQIYLMDLQTGSTQRISPGLGKTTCAWVHPKGDRVLFASTHADPDAAAKQAEELKQRESGQERRYSWDYDEFYDLYEYDVQTSMSTRLTQSPGYDAEGSWSPDGRLIAFASNRSAYTEELTPEQRKQFELDPAWANEIYLMHADGTNLQRLTNMPGYDGGPFFSPDGTRICWRRFSENGATAEIMTMKIDGTDQRQLTSLGAMSWAPFYHPSGKYLIFTTNKHGFANFELYMVDAEATHEPVRVTYTTGFDGLPVFTPDGQHLAWTTNRTSTGQSQIFMADWNHRRALELLGLNTSATETAVEMKQAATARAPEARGAFAPADAVRHVEYLCRPELGGRLTGTKGERLATNYVALHFETLGLEPAGDDGGWFQNFEFTAGVDTGSDNRLAANNREFVLNEDWRPTSFARNGIYSATDMIFAGYGIQAPAGEGFDEYDSFVHLDVKDKWVLCFRFMPEDISAEQRQYLSRFASLRYKAMLVRDLGARGLILVSGPASGVRDQLIPLQFDGSLSGTSLPVISVTDQLVADWFAEAGKDLASVQKKLDTGEPAMGFPVEGVQLEATIDIQQVKKTGRNVLGRLQLNDSPAHQIVVVGAHIDHLGTGANTSSLARDEEQTGIHYGADDNASGVSAMLQMAEAMAKSRENGQLTGNRDVVFAAWSGEELGLLGSSHYVKQLETMFSQHAADVGGATAPRGGSSEKSADQTPAPDADRTSPAAETTPPADETATKADDAAGNADDAAGKPPSADLTGPNTGGLHLYIAACLNMDMVGRMQEKLVLQGTGSSSAWQRIVEAANVPLGLPITMQQDSYIPTDASVFFIHGVPILSAFTGNHGEYHTPRDTPEKLNYEGISRIAHLMSLICQQLVSMEHPPAYVMQERPQEGQRRASLRAYLGSVPDYAGSDVEGVGVLLGDVRIGAPIEKAGVRRGDIIVKLAGRKIENIYDYTYAIDALKIGQEVEIIILRNGEEIALKVTPGSRD